MRWVLLLSVLLLSVLLATPAWAESQFTPPLPSAELADGVLTVKVVGEQLEEVLVGERLVLYRVTAAGLERWQTAQTGEDGRARFSGLQASEQYVIGVLRGAAEERSPRFAGPARGGIRVLLTYGAALEGMALPAGHPSLATTELPSSEPAPQLPAGQLQIVVRRGKQHAEPLAGAEVRVTSEAAAEPLRSGQTDREGQLLLTLARDARYLVRVSHDKLTYRSEPLSLPAAHGLRVNFVVFDRTTDPRDLAIDAGAHRVCQLGEGVVRCMQTLQLVQRSERAFEPGPAGITLPLPVGAAAIEIPEELAPVLQHDEQHQALRLRAPVSPLGLPLRVFYELPYRNGQLELRERVTLDLPASTLVLLDGEGVHVHGPALAGPPRANVAGRAGRLFPLRALARGAVLELSFSGLPTRDRRPLYAVLAWAGLLLLWGLFAAKRGPAELAQRQASRARVLKELVVLRRARGKASHTKQQELVRELMQDWDEPW